MPTYEITAPDGSVLSMEGPENAHAEAEARMRAHWEGQQNVTADVAKSAGIGVAKGAIGIPGLPGDIAHLVPNAADWLRDKAVKYGVMTPESAAADRAREEAKGMRNIPIPGSPEIQHAVEGYTGKFYQPKTAAGQYAQTAGEFLPAAMAGPGSLARRTASGVTGGLASEYAGQKTAGTDWEPWARFAGGVAGSFGPQAAAHAVTPIPTSPARQAAVDTLRQAGVTDLTAGQTTGSFPLRKAESMSSEIPFGSHKAAIAEESSRGQFTNAALETMGEQGERATAEVMARAHQRLGQAFNDLSQRNNLQYDMPMVQDLHRVHNEYTRVLPSQQKDVINNYIDDMNAQGYGMSGPMYQDTRSRLSRQSNAVKNNDPAFSQALRGLRDTLDSAMDRSISPQDREAWQTARRQYGNMRRIENAVATSGELITPNALATAAKTGRRGQYVRGEGDLDQLAHAGKQVMSTLPNSGTPGGMLAMENLATLGGGYAGHEMAGLPGGLTGAILGRTAPAIGSRALMSDLVQGYLGNQALRHNFAPDTRSGRLARVLMQSQLPSRERDKKTVPSP